MTGLAAVTILACMFPHPFTLHVRCLLSACKACCSSSAWPQCSHPSSLLSCPSLLALHPPDPWAGCNLSADTQRSCTLKA